MGVGAAAQPTKRVSAPSMPAAALARLVVALALAPCAGAVWGVVLDMGSSGTRVRIHTWEAAAPMTEFVPADDDDADALEVHPGLADVQPQDVGAYLRPLVAQAVRWVPPAQAPTTRVRAYATAGMRALDSDAQRAIWSEVRAVLADSSVSPFLFDAVDATTISGNLEGLFGFLAVNFILEQAASGAGAGAGGGGAQQQLVGAMDLGGASMELAFAPDNDAPIMADAYKATVNDQTTQVYSHSYMNAGQDVARERLAAQLVQQSGGVHLAPQPIPNPCLSAGYLDNRTISGSAVQFIGMGQYDACIALMPGLLHPEYECLQSPCAAMGVYQPILPSARHSLVAYSAFFYTINGIMGDVVGWGDASGVDGVPDVTPNMIKERGRAWCARPWPEVASRYAAAYCFSSAYIPAMLEIFGVDDDSEQISYSRKLHGYSVEWSLGAQLYYAADDINYYNIATDESTGAHTCVAPGVVPAGAAATGGDGDASCFGLGTLIGLCFLNAVVGATLGQLCKTKQAAGAAGGGGGGGGEGIYAGGGGVGGSDMQ